jgi:hypothetical protein
MTREREGITFDGEGAGNPSRRGENAMMIVVFGPERREGAARALAEAGDRIGIRSAAVGGLLARVVERKAGE